MKIKSRRMAALCLSLLLPVASGGNSFIAFAQDEDDSLFDIVADEQPEDAEEISEDDTEARYQGQIEEYNDRLSALQEEQNSIQKNIDSAKTDRQREEAGKSAIDRQIGLAQQEIGLLMDRYNLLGESIEEKRRGAEEKQAAIYNRQSALEQQYQTYLLRLRNMQLYDEGTMLGLLLGAESFAGYLSASETMSRIAAYDRELIQGLKDEQMALEAAKEDLELEIEGLENSKAELEQERGFIEDKKQDLAVRQAQVQQKIQDIERMEQEFMADLENNKQTEARMKAELDRIFQEVEWGKNPYAGGAMDWPVPGFTTVTSPYGWRFSGSDFHTGNDISGSGINGTEVRAAADGVVRKANWANTPGQGYGIYTILDHGVTEDGKSLSTLYAHLSNIQVSEGQNVKKGQVIGTVGSTGWSTGPHLHFEVRLDGQHTNSLPYIQ